MVTQVFSFFIGEMKTSVVAVSFLFACFCIVSFASIPSRSSLRFNEVNGNNLGPNSVSHETVQDFSIDRNAILNRAVSSGKIAPLAINANQVAPGAITTSGASLDLVTLFIRDIDTVPSETQHINVQMQSGAQALQPFEAINDPNRVIVDDPDSDTSYRVEGKARGSGIILGWYPSKNGHLLRYQSSRALRGLVCANIDIESVNFSCDCVNCDCSPSYVDTNFSSSIPDCRACTVLDCNPPNADLPDFQCQSAFVPVDGNGGALPDRCGSYTSVSDVNNPQEGVPVYSPSVERITIDDTGRVEMWFFGRGTVTGPHEDIEITVVVLLDEQYGA